MRMRVVPPGVTSAQNGNPRHQPGERSAREIASAHSKLANLEYTFPGIETVVASRSGNDSQWLTFPGKVFQITELIGASVIGVRFDTADSQFLRMQEGDSYEGDFERVQFRALQNVRRVESALYPGRYPDIAVRGIVTNGGRLVKSDARHDGFNDGFPIWKVSATTTGVNIADALNSMLFATVDDVATPGANGGTLTIKNMSAQTVYLFNQALNSSLTAPAFDPTSGVFPNPSSAWPLESGETVSLKFKSRCSTLCAACLAGTAELRVMADAQGDRSQVGKVSLG